MKLQVLYHSFSLSSFSFSLIFLLYLMWSFQLLHFLSCSGRKVLQPMTSHSSWKNFSSNLRHGFSWLVFRNHVVNSTRFFVGYFLTEFEAITSIHLKNVNYRIWVVIRWIWAGSSEVERRRGSDKFCYASFSRSPSLSLLVLSRFPHIIHQLPVQHSSCVLLLLLLSLTLFFSSRRVVRELSFLKHLAQFRFSLLCLETQIICSLSSLPSPETFLRFIPFLRRHSPGL